WLSAIIVYGMFALGLWMVTLSYYDGWYHKAPELHKSIGILLMMGLVIRVLYARKNTKVVVVRFAAKKARYRQKNSDAVGQDVTIFLSLCACIISTAFG
ncbi:cytochrome b, partial [Escherichia sp. TWPC-MK]